jgi:hypothetical protein
VISKILAGVFAVAVLIVGGYAYWQYADGAADTPTQSSGCSSQPTQVLPCCQEPSRANYLTGPADISCCRDTDNGSPAEAIAIPPREIK